MPLSGVDRLLWATGFLGHVVLLAVLLFRGRARSFPVFTALIAWSVLRTATLFLLRGHESAYRSAYIVLQLVDASLQLAVVYEVAWHVFRPLGRWVPEARRGMQWLILVSVAIASGLTWLAAPETSGWQRTILVKSNFFSSALMVELFLGMVALSVTVGLPWRTHVARIAHGLGVYSLLDLALEAGHAVYGPSYGAINNSLTLTRMTVYLLCLGYWIVTLWREAPQPRQMSPQMLENLRTLQARVAYDLYTFRKWRKP